MTVNWCFNDSKKPRICWSWLLRIRSAQEMGRSSASMFVSCPLFFVTELLISSLRWIVYFTSQLGWLPCEQHPYTDKSVRFINYPLSRLYSWTVRRRSADFTNSDSDTSSNNNQTNTAVKGIIGIACMAKIAELAGVGSDEQKYNVSPQSDSSLARNTEIRPSNRTFHVNTEHCYEL